MSRERRRPYHEGALIDTDSFILQARAVAPMDQPLLDKGAVAIVGGRIIAVGKQTDVRRAYPHLRVDDCGDAVLLPGLINAHSHLELSMCACGPAPSSFADWILALPARVGPDRDFASAARAGAARSLKFGVTCVGDISQQSHWTRPALRGGPLRVVSFGEALGIGSGRNKFDDLLQKAVDVSSESEFLRVGVSPHAPYSVDLRDFRRAVDLARLRTLQIATHVSEQQAEYEFLAEKTGAFRSLLERIGSWRSDVETFRGTPIEFVKEVGVLKARSLLAHVNYCNDTDLHLLAMGQASVVWCPRTHGYFGHPPHRWRDMISRGINVAVGTDSLASSPDLNVVNDLRMIWQDSPKKDAPLLWSMVTARAAHALTMEKHVGTLTPGKLADVVAFPVNSDRPLDELLDHPILPSGVWVAGCRVA